MPETTPLIKAALNLRVGAGFDVYHFSHTPILLIVFFFYLRYKLYSDPQNIPCELLEFSLSTRQIYLSFSTHDAYLS